MPLWAGPAKPGLWLRGGLGKHVPANVKAVQAAFEDLRSGESYGLVYAAAALYWTKPERR